MRLIFKAIIRFWNEKKVFIQPQNKNREFVQQETITIGSKWTYFDWAINSKLINYFVNCIHSLSESNLRLPHLLFYYSVCLIEIHKLKQHYKNEIKFKLKTQNEFDLFRTNRAHDE